jgi:hypothetical protein
MIFSRDSGDVWYSGLVAELFKAVLRAAEFNLERSLSNVRAERLL